MTTIDDPTGASRADESKNPSVDTPSPGVRTADDATASADTSIAQPAGDAGKDGGDPGADGPLRETAKRFRGPRPRTRFSREQLVADARTDTPENPEVPDSDFGRVGVLAPDVLAIHDLGVEEALLLAARLKALAPLWADRDATDAPLEAGGVQDMHVAAALRVTTARAYQLIRDAHHAVTNFPTCLALLEQGEFPAAWFVGLLRRVKNLPADAQHVIDDTISSWDLTCGAEAFTRNLRALVTALKALLEDPVVEAKDRRRVELRGPVADDGIACVSIHGPAPEIAEYVARIDAAARATQTAQRRALRTGETVPFDPDGQAATNGEALTRAQLRYLITTRTDLDTDGVEVPPLRYRINVTVPALTLLEKSETPGLVDGVTPIPADMARDLAGGCQTWYRILTEPSTGAFLPLPADTYTPTAAMREHLRLRHPVCAAPGCTRPSMSGEIDHITEYDHQNPENGGHTEIANLHILCKYHHELKTRRHIDPTRNGAAPAAPGDRPAASASADVPGRMTDRAIPTDTISNSESHPRHDPGVDPSSAPGDECASEPGKETAPLPVFVDETDDHSGPYALPRLQTLRDAAKRPHRSRRVEAAQERARGRHQHRVARSIDTTGDLDPGRTPATETGSTHWQLGPEAATITEDDYDLLTPMTMRGLDDSWNTYLNTRHEAREHAEREEHERQARLERRARDQENNPPPY